MNTEITELNTEELTKLIDGLKNSILDSINNHLRDRHKELENRSFNGAMAMQTALLACVHHLVRMKDKKNNYHVEIVTAMGAITAILFNLVDEIKDSKPVTH